MHQLSNQVIQSIDEISQVCARWEVSNNSHNFEIVVKEYYKLGGEVVYGGYYKCLSSPEYGGDACGDEHKTESEALGDLVLRIAAFNPVEQ